MAVETKKPAASATQSNGNEPPKPKKERKKREPSQFPALDFKQRLMRICLRAVTEKTVSAASCSTLLKSIASDLDLIQPMNKETVQPA